MAMRQLSPQQVAKNWQNGMANSTEKLKAGVMAVTEAPTAKAAQAVDRQVAGVQRAAASGKTAAALNRVTLPEWQNAMINKGAARVAAGAAAAVGKMQAFMSEFLPYLQQGVQQLSAMPRGDLEQNIARANFMMRYNAGFRGGR